MCVCVGVCTLYSSSFFSLLKSVSPVANSPPSKSDSADVVACQRIWGGFYSVIVRCVFVFGAVKRDYERVSQGCGLPLAISH